jgi:flagellar protein FlaG
MTINPQQNAVLVGELGTRRVDRPVAPESRRTGAVTAPPSEAAKDAAALADEKAAQQTEPAPDAAPGFPLQELSIRKDPEIDRVVVQVLDAKTHEVVRQIPSEEWVRVLKRLRGAKGLFVDRKG